MHASINPNSSGGLSPWSAGLAFSISLFFVSPSKADEAATHANMDATMAEWAALLDQDPCPEPEEVGVLERSTLGTWSDVIDFPTTAITAANLPDGRVIVFANGVNASIFNPVTNAIEVVPFSDYTLFCGGPALLATGQLFVSGGGPTGTPAQTSTIFDSESNQWMPQALMNDSRWYPGSTALPNGDLITAAGVGTGTQTMEYWSPDSGWRPLPGVPLTTVSQGSFPYNFVAPNGKIFYGGPRGDFHWIDLSTTDGSIEDTNVPPAVSHSGQGNGVVIYDVGKVLVAGGNTLKASTIDFNNNVPVSTEVASLHRKRRFHNGLVLPNGNVIVVGGNENGQTFDDSLSVLAAEMWDPDTDEWTLLAEMENPRNYHSTALLLRDGRVFSAGSGSFGNQIFTHKNAEIFTPPYMYHADGCLRDRPSIINCCDVMKPGSTHTVTASPNVDRFTMIRMSSTTHAHSSDVRFLEVPFTDLGNGEYSVTVHSNENVVVPGMWMLFALDADEMPSVSKIVRIALPSAPEIANPGEQYSLLGNAIDFQINGSDLDGDPLTYSATNLPAGISISSTGHITGTPNTAGTSATVVSATDGENTTQVSFSWTIAEQSGLIAYWPMDENTGTQTDDFGNGNAPGTLQNGATWVEGIQNSAIQFNGNAHVLVNNHSSLEVGDNNEDFSLSYWLHLDQGSSGSWRSLVHKGNSNSERTFAMWMRPDDNRVHFAVSTESATSTAASSTSELQLGKWTHLVLVKKDNQLTLYIDGNQDGQRSLPSPVVSNNGPLTIGDSPYSAVAESAMDQMALYGRAITTSEIQLLANPENPIIGTVPLFQPLANQSSRIGESIALTANAVVPAGLSVTYSVTGLPDGININANSGVISGAPTIEGNFNPVITATTELTSATIAFSWTIAESLELTPIVTTPNTSNTNFSFSLAAPSGTGLTYSWSFGDNTTATTTEPSVNHNYTSPGRYEIRVTVSDGINSANTTFFQTVHANLPNTYPTRSSSIVYESGANRIWNVNPDNQSVTVSNASNLNVIEEIPVGRNPRSLAVASTGEIWVTNKDDAMISVINPSSLNVVREVGLPTGSAPHGIARNPTNSHLFVALQGTGEVVKINANNDSILGSADVGTDPRHVSINGDGDKLYVSRFITPPLVGESTVNPVINTQEGGEVLVINPNTLAVTKTIVLRQSLDEDTEGSARGIPNYLGAVAISPNGSVGWVPSKQDNIFRGALRDGSLLTHDNTLRSIASRINLNNENEVRLARFDFDNGGTPSASTFGRYGNYVFTALEGTREVVVLDAYSNEVVGSFDVGRAPQGLTVSPDGNQIFVHNFLDRSVSSHNVSQLLNGSGATPSLEDSNITVSNETLTAQELLGKQLFYDTKDPRLAREGYISCASCHNEGGHDGRVWDISQFGEGLRNTTDLRGRGGLNHGPLHWSGNFDEVQDFENQIRDLAGGTGLINGAVHPPTGPPNTGRSADLDALAAYVGSLIKFPKSPYSNPDGSLTTAGQNGLQVFQAKGCVTCHSSDPFTDSAWNLFHDIGTISTASGQRLGAALTGFDTPTLRGVWNGAPYLHDGSAATLADAINAHSGVSLTTGEMDQLVAFLNEIDGNQGPVAATGIDLVDVTLSEDNGQICVTYTNTTPIVLNDGWMLFMDTDQNPATGYQIYNRGADLLLRGDNVFSYTGDGSNWSWNFIGQASSSFSGTQAEVCFPSAWAGNVNTLEAVFFGDNSAYEGQSGVSVYPPDAGAGNHLSLTVSGGGNNSIVIDGDVSDWPDANFIGFDPDDVTGAANQIDLREVYLFEENDTFYGFYVNDQNFDLNDGWMTFIDSDQSGNTGYAAWSLGADYLLRGEDVFAYTGTGSNWSWSLVGTADVAVNNQYLEFGFPKSWIGNPATFDFLFYGNNSAYVGGSGTDVYPQNGTGSTYSAGGETAITLDGFLTDWNTSLLLADDDDDISGAQNSIDFRQIYLTHDAGSVYLGYHNDSPVTLDDSWIVWIDTDENPDTGFKAWGVGADYMLQGNVIKRYTGNGSNWAWSVEGQATSAPLGDNLEMQFERSLIGDPATMNLLFYGNNPATGGDDADIAPEPETDPAGAVYSF